MKNLKFYGFAVILLLGFWSCDENEPVIPCLSCNDQQVVVEPTAQKVLIEEFTGVRCVNCPAGSSEIQNLLGIHGEQMVAVSIHAGFFANPYSESREDYKTPEGNSLNDFLDFPNAYPTASINRKVFQNENDLQVGRNSWGGLIQQEKILFSPITLDLTVSYQSGTRQLTATTDIQVAETVDGIYRYSVMVVENNITDVQLTPEGIEENYVHKHVLRDMMTPFNGESIDGTFIEGSTITKEHQMILPDNWVADEISVVVFVHQDGGTGREVIQVEEAGLSE